MNKEQLKSIIDSPMNFDESTEETQDQHSAPDVDAEAKEERTVENVKKEKAKREQKKVAQKGIFKRFRRKSIG